MGKIINPATKKPFFEANPTSEIKQIRNVIIRQLTNKYDAAQTTSQNELHWRWADNLSPNAANTLQVRKTLRDRSRYEAANNGYLKGIGLTLTQDFVGSGPTIQITDSRFTDEQKKTIQRCWGQYCKKIKLRRKLWRSRYAKFQDGETFMFGFYNNQIRHPIKYDYRLYECDQVSHNLTINPQQNPNEIDGIRFDRMSGEPAEYHLLNQHPGEQELFSLYQQPWEGKWYPKQQVTHWFRQDRPWLRGIPETATTLPLWALLRRYTLAVVQSAEIAADFTALLESLQNAAPIPFSLTGTPGQPTQLPEDWFNSFPIDRGLMTVLPSGYKMSQLKPEQPVTMYDDFVCALIQEASRPLLCPRNLALGNSGGYNMSSGTLDRQLYAQAIQQERLDCNDEVIDPCFTTWWYEAIRIPNYFDDEYVSISPILSVVNRFRSLREEPPEHTHKWDEVSEHTDPVKVATALDILVKGGHLSDIDVQETRFNRSVEEHYENLEKQYAWREAHPSPQEKAAVKAAEAKPIRTKGVG
jgi:hypothetical protein